MTSDERPPTCLDVLKQGAALETGACRNQVEEKKCEEGDGKIT